MDTISYGFKSLKQFEEIFINAWRSTFLHSYPKGRDVFICVLA